MSKIDITGMKFGRLTVVSEAGLDRRGEVKWHCRCECGSEHVALSSNLRKGATTSCGCYRSEQLLLRNYGPRGKARKRSSWARTINRNWHHGGSIEDLEDLLR